MALEFDVLTLFPAMFEGPLAASIPGRIQEQGLVTIRVLPSHRAVAGASSCRPMSGRLRNTVSTRSMASATYCADMMLSLGSCAAIVGASGPCA